MSTPATLDASDRSTVLDEPRVARLRELARGARVNGGTDALRHRAHGRLCRCTRREVEHGYRRELGEHAAVVLVEQLLPGAPSQGWTQALGAEPRQRPAALAERL